MEQTTSSNKIFNDVIEQTDQTDQTDIMVNYDNI